MSRSGKKDKPPHRLQWVVEPIMEEPSYLQKSMFGCQACYLNGRLVLALSSGEEPWNGLLIPTDHLYQASIRADFEEVRQHPLLKKWLYLPEASEDFETTAVSIVEAIGRKDARFGVELRPKPPARKKR